MLTSLQCIWVHQPDEKKKIYIYDIAMTDQVILSLIHLLDLFEDLDQVKSLYEQ